MRSIRRTNRYYKYNCNRRKNNRGKYFLFIIGEALILIGILSVFSNTVIYSGIGLSMMYGIGKPFGIYLLPIIFGIAILFFNKRSKLGGLLIAFGIFTMLIGVLLSLRIGFKPISLFKTILMFGAIAAGGGLVLKNIFLR